MQVTQYSCSSDCIASREGCFQYYTGVSGKKTVGALASLPAVPSINYTTQANDVFQELSRVSTLPTLPSSQLLTTRPVLDQRLATVA